MSTTEILLESKTARDGQLPKYKRGDIVYSRRRKSTFILQSRERSGSQWYCYLADETTYEPILREKFGCLSPIDCYAWEYDFELVQG